MWWEYSALASTLSDKSQNAKVYYLPCHGNWGDGLIREGSLKFFKMLGLRYAEINRRSIKTGDELPRKESKSRRLLIYGGGGGWCHLYQGSIELVSRLAPLFSEVVVLPSSYEEKPLIHNVTWFARDKYQSMENVPSAEFCHDLAFLLKPLSLKKGRGDGWFMRTDKESLRKYSIPENNLDLSLKGNYKKSSRDFFHHLDQYAVIHTDRLHVAIGGALLEKKVRLYPGAYFKNEAVWKSSMQEYYPKVEYIGV